MKKKFVTSVFAVFLLLLQAHSQVQPNQQALLNSISSKAVTINSIDWENVDYSDLNKLIPILKNVTVLALGESRHDDGSTFKAKMRLVKFLHEKMGFEVLAFESSFYGGTLANAEMDKENSNLVTANRNVGGWFNSEYGYQLLQYAKDTRKTKSSLILAGFDMEKLPNAVPNTIALVNRIYKLVDWVPVDSVMKGKIDSLIRGVQGPIGNPYYPAIKYSKSRTEAKNQLKVLLKEFENNQEKLSAVLGKEEYKVIKLALLSLLMANETLELGDDYTFGWNAFRDNFMGKRMQWLTDSLYPGKKIILWAATGHLMRNTISIERKEQSKYDLFNFYPIYQAGDYFHQLYGDKYYCIAFTSYKGEYGLLFPNTPDKKQYEYKSPVPVSEPGSFEDLFHRLNKPYLFYDLRNAKSPLVSAKVPAHPLGYYNDVANWSKIIDAFFFIDTMEPDVWRETKK